MVLKKVALDGKIERDARVSSAIARLTNHGLPDVAEPLPVLFIGTQLAEDRGPEPEQLRPADGAPLLRRMQSLDQRGDHFFFCAGLRRRAGTIRDLMLIQPRRLARLAVRDESSERDKSGDDPLQGIIIPVRPNRSLTVAAHNGLCPAGNIVAEPRP